MLINNMNQLKGLFKKDSSIAVDLETCDPSLKYIGPGWINPAILKGHICGICLADDKNSVYIPVGHEQGHNLDKKEVYTWLQDLLSDPNYPVVMHNAQYDLGWLMEEGVFPKGRIIDTMFLAALIDEQRYSYSLDSLAKDYLKTSKSEQGMYDQIDKEFTGTDKVNKIKYASKHKHRKIKKTITEKTFIEKNLAEEWDIVEKITEVSDKSIPIKKSDKKGMLWRLDPIHVAEYGCQDARVTYDLYRLLYPKIHDEGLTTVMELETDLIPCHVAMRKKGIRVDMEKAAEAKKSFAEKRDSHIQAMRDLSGVNITKDDLSKARLIAQACDNLGIEYSYTEKGMPSFAKKTMPVGYEFIDHLVQARKFEKAINVFIDSYIYGFEINGRIHPQLNQLRSDDGGTVTGRYSCSNPNLQNIPTRDPDIGPIMRSLFVPDEGEDLLVLDYSGQEPRMLVHLAIEYDKPMRPINGIEIAKDPMFSSRDADFHTTVATLSGETRKDAKAIGLGIMYCMGVGTMHENMTTGNDRELTVEEVRQIRKSIMDAVPFLADVNQRAIEEAEQNGFARTILGRKRRYNEFSVTEFDKVNVTLEDGSITEKTVMVREYKFKSNREALKFRAVNSGKNLGQPRRYKSYTALNAKIQGSSADQTKCATRKFWNMYKRGECALPLLLVHDEVVFSIPKDDSIEKYREVMETVVKLRCATKADGSTGANWKEAK